jgi:hypothetical protein
VACASQLPSETPLGVGPLAGRDPGTKPAASAPNLTPEPPPASSALALAESRSDAAHSPVSATSDAGVRAEPLRNEAGATPDVATQAAFAGDYAGTDRATTRMAGMPPQTENDPKARITIADKTPGMIAITLVDSSNGSKICTLDAKTTGVRAEVAPGQVCFGANTPEVSSRVRTGSAVLAGTRLTFDMFIEIEFAIQGQRQTGSIEYHFEGNRR